MANLQPLDLVTRLKIALEATTFFLLDAAKLGSAEEASKWFKDNHIEYKSASDFIEHLNTQKAIIDNPYKHIVAIERLLDSMARVGTLREMGFKVSGNAKVSKRYDCWNQQTTLQKLGKFWMADALGSDFLYYLAAPGIVQITGKAKENDEACAGTGLIFQPRYILTCAHVINDSTLDKNQTTIRGTQYKIVKELSHPDLDVGLLKVDRDLPTVPGLAFLDPVIGKKIYALGFPKIPLSKEAQLIMQSGEITCEQVTTLWDENVFLFSAIIRPGNSGGPIFTSDGYVVGISMQDLIEKQSDNVSFSPHYAGISASEVARCVSELDEKAIIPIEDFN